jgi:predicted dinucleotide-binding enzyme
MRYGVLGTGDVGQAIGRGLVTLGHDVMMGSRDPQNAKARSWADALGPKASVGSFADAAKFGEVVVLATLGVANAEAIKLAGPGNMFGKIVVDTTNPLDFSQGMPPRLAISGEDSGGEEVQRLIPGAKVVKCFNTVGNALMFRPDLAGGPPDMFIAGNSDEAKAAVARLLSDFGWGVVDTGGITSSRYLEAMCLVWVISGAKTGQWRQAFKMLR